MSVNDTIPFNKDDFKYQIKFKSVLTPECIYWGIERFGTYLLQLESDKVYPIYYVHGNWCWNIGATIVYFKKEEDMVLFRLTWSELC